jgi:hypothetical protein
MLTQPKKRATALLSSVSLAGILVVASIATIGMMQTNASAAKNAFFATHSKEPPSLQKQKLQREV